MKSLKWISVTPNRSDWIPIELFLRIRVEIEVYG